VVKSRPFRQEAAIVWKLYEAGVVREICYREDMRGVFISADAENASSLLQELNRLPMVRDEVLSLEIIALLPFTGFKALFKS
jgi:hypothetical protein